MIISVSKQQREEAWSALLVDQGWQEWNLPDRPSASLFVWNWCWQIVIQDPSNNADTETRCLVYLPDRPSASRGRWRQCQKGPWSGWWGRREAPQWCSSKPSWSSSISIERGPLLLVRFSSNGTPPQMISAKFSLHTDHITSRTQHWKTVLTWKGCNPAPLVTEDHSLASKAQTSQTALIVDVLWWRRMCSHCAPLSLSKLVPLKVCWSPRGCETDSLSGPYDGQKIVMLMKFR